MHPFSILCDGRRGQARSQGEGPGDQDPSRNDRKFKKFDMFDILSAYYMDDSSDSAILSLA